MLRILDGVFMTVKEIRAMLAESAAILQKTNLIVQETAHEMRESERNLDRLFKETDRKMQETDRQMQETDRQMQETASQMRETDRKIENLSKQIGGIDNNIGYHAEQFFQNVFLENKVFGGIKYDEAIPNMKHGNDVEFDIFLKNCDSVAIIEIKNRIHQGFVKKMAEKRFGEFRKYFPEYKDRDVYLGIAGFSFDEKVLSEAQKYGIGIIKQVGEGIEVKTKGLRAYR